MTRYIAAYDTESSGCLKAVEAITEVHRKYDMPATFFIVGRTLEANPDEYKRLMADPLFEVASHTLSHKMLRDHPWCGRAATADEIRREIISGVDSVRKNLKVDCLGLRPGCCFENGLVGAPELLALAAEAGLKYVSSQAWGRDYSLPAPLAQPFAYSDDGFPGIWEIPAHGWHDNLLKDNNRWGSKRLTLWPPEMPEAIPDSFLRTPEQEAELNFVFLEKAVRENLSFVSLIWHPWSLDRFDPQMRMLELTFERVRTLGAEATTYSDFRRELDP